jgi:hypothetical protein
MTYPTGTAARLVEVALVEVGTIEEGDNLTKYGKFMKADGLPWCGSFVNWCADQSGIKIPSMVSTAAGANKMKDLGRWITEKPQVVDLCFMDFPHDGIDRISHIGIVVKAGATSVICVEGNTSGTGDQRNGGMVMIKRRAIGKEVVGFARPKLVAYSGEYPAVEIPDEAPKKGNKKK